MHRLPVLRAALVRQPCPHHETTAGFRMVDGRRKPPRRAASIHFVVAQPLVRRELLKAISQSPTRLNRTHGQIIHRFALTQELQPGLIHDRDPPALIRTRKLHDSWHRSALLIPVLKTQIPAASVNSSSIGSCPRDVSYIEY